MAEIDRQTILDSVGPVQTILDAHDGIVNVIDTSGGDLNFIGGWLHRMQLNSNDCNANLLFLDEVG